MSLIRFVHTADLHLDRQFRGLRGTPRAIADALRDATFDAYQQIIDFTIEQEVDALLVAGDIYDGEDRSLRAQLRFVEGVERLDAAGIRSFICHGAADPLDDWTSRMRFPPLAHCFGSIIEAVPARSDGSVEVVGISHPQTPPPNSLARAVDSATSAPFSIGMFHGELTRTFDALPDLAVDYWALGGRHQPEVLREDSPVAIYPGAAQGTRPGEDGPHGVWLVEIDEHGLASFRFEALDAIRWVSISVGTTKDESDAALLDRLGEHVREWLDAAQGRPIIYQVSLESESSSTGSLAAERNLRNITSQLNEHFGERETFAWCHRLAHSPVELADRERRMQAGDMVAQLLHIRDDIMSDSDLRKRLWDELAVLLDDDRFDRYRSSAGLTDEQRTAIIQEAEAAILEALGAQS